MSLRLIDRRASVDLVENFPRVLLRFVEYKLEREALPDMVHEGVLNFSAYRQNLAFTLRVGPHRRSDAARLPGEINAVDVRGQGSQRFATNRQKTKFLPDQVTKFAFRQQSGDVPPSSLSQSKANGRRALSDCHVYCPQLPKLLLYIFINIC